MMTWWHCSGCRQPLTASHIQIGCMKSVWAPSFAADRHMSAPSLRSYTGKVDQDFGNLGSVWLWYDDMKTLLWLKTTTNCFPHLYWMYGIFLSTFIFCGYAYWWTLTQLHLGRLPTLWQFGVSVATIKWWHDDIVEAIDHNWLLPPFIFDVLKVFEHLHMLWIGMWVYPYTVTPGKVSPDFGNLGSLWLWIDGMMTLLRL